MQAERGDTLEDLLWVTPMLVVVLELAKDLQPWCGHSGSAQARVVAVVVAVEIAAGPTASGAHQAQEVLRAGAAVVRARVVAVPARTT